MMLNSFLFNGFFLFIQRVISIIGDSLLQENGDRLLQENGDVILLE